MDRDELIEFLRENLRIEVETTSNYTGGMDGGDLYRNISTIQIVLCGEVISEAYP